MKMRIYLTLVFLLTLPIYCIAQQSEGYNSLITAAENDLRQSKYAEALENYTAALAISETPSHHIYNAACAAAKVGKIDRAYELLFRRLTVDKDWYSERIAQDADLSSLRNDERWATLIDSMKGRAERYESRFDRKLRSELKDIMAKDQDIRQEYITAQAHNLPHVMDSLIVRMRQTDSLNQRRITNLLDRYGWLGSSEVGDLASVQFYILQHAPLEMQLKYRKHLKKGLKSADISPAQYAMFEDRIAVQSGRKQKYGSQILYDKTGKPYVAPCVNARKVNGLRQKAGLQPMNQYLQRWGLLWNY